MRIAHRTLFGALIALCVPSGAPLSAQVTDAFEWGVLAGPTRTAVKGVEAPANVSSRTGVVAGASLVWSEGGLLGVEVDALHAFKGFSAAGSGGSSSVSMGFIEVPMLLRLQRSTEHRVRPFVAVGLSAGFRATCGAAVTAQGQTTHTSCRAYQDANFVDLAQTAVSTVYSGGVTFPVSSLQLTVGGRYTGTFTSVFTNRANHFEARSVFLGISRARQR